MPEIVPGRGAWGPGTRVRNEHFTSDSDTDVLSAAQARLIAVPVSLC